MLINVLNSRQMSDLFLNVTFCDLVYITRLNSYSAERIPKPCTDSNHYITINRIHLFAKGVECTE